MLTKNTNKSQPKGNVSGQTTETMGSNTETRSTVGMSFDDYFGSLAKGYSTRLIHFGQEPETLGFNSLVTPIVLSTSFEKFSVSDRMTNLSSLSEQEKPIGTGEHEEPGFLERLTEKITGKTSGEMKESGKGVIKSAVEKLTGTQEPKGDVRQTGSTRTSGLTETTCTGLPEVKGSDTTGLLQTGRGSEVESKTRKTHTGEIGSVLSGMTMPKTSVEGEIGTFASTYESSLPGRGLPLNPGFGIETHFGRMHNPTRFSLENSLTTLEDCKYAISFPSGTSALTACGFLCENENHVLVLDEVYSATAKFFRDCVSRMGIDVTFVDMTDLNATAGAVKPNTAMVWIETPTNPSMKIIDIKAVNDIVRKTNPNTIVVVDNTLATPLFQRPLNLGADIVLHSLTKHINGHLDCVMGALMTNREDLYRKLLNIQDELGIVPSPMDCYLVNRSIKTFPIRMKEQMNSSMKIAKYLQNHPAISNIYYPGLDNHPQKDIFTKQMCGFAGVITMVLKGTALDAKIFINSLRLFSCAENLGGYVSLVDQPLLNGTKDVDTNPNLIRLSIGLEDSDDLLNDILTALEKIRTKTTTIVGTTTGTKTDTTSGTSTGTTTHTTTGTSTGIKTGTAASGSNNTSKSSVTSGVFTK